jgi:purine nucleosidase
MNLPRTFLIDTDTASDDAVALLMALGAEDIRLAAITTVAGNVSLEQATRNALYTVELCGADVPVYPGAAKPLTRPLQDATWFHGRDGLGDHGFQPRRRTPESGHAVDAIIETIRANPGLTLVTLGPLTNIAMALLREPGIIPHVGRTVVMGGNPCCEGNVTPAAEFNIWVDPEAASIVLHSGLKVELIGWQLCRGQAVLGPAEIEQVLSWNSPRSRFAIESNSTARQALMTQTGEDGICLPDPVAMAIALDPGIGIVWGDHYVDVETHSELTRGMTVVDRLNVAGDPRNREVWSSLLSSPPNARVCWAIDVRRWKEALFSFLR